MDIKEYKDDVLSVIRGLKIDLSHEDLPNFSMFYRILKNHPTIAVLNTRVENGQVMLYNLSSAIEHITGYTPSELHGQPLSMIMPGEPDENSVAKLKAEIDRYKASDKYNIIKHKDGHLVKTIGIIFEEGKNQYFEMVHIDRS